MKYRKIKEAVFMERPNRFIAHVMIDGEVKKAHVKNTGRCRELLQEGVRLYLEDHGESRAGRKTDYSLIAVEKRDDRVKSGKRLVNMDSLAPNRVVFEALEGGRLVLPGLGYPLCRIKPETTFGASRFDFYVEDAGGEKALIEVKGVTLEDEGVARFPDAPTERGVKHIRELCQALDEGFSAYLIFVIQMKEILRFEPNDDTHPAFGDALREAYDKGVVILAYDCGVTADSIALGEPVAVRLEK